MVSSSLTRGGFGLHHHDDAINSDSRLLLPQVQSQSNAIAAGKHFIACLFNNIIACTFLTIFTQLHPHDTSSSCIDRSTGNMSCLRPCFPPLIYILNTLLLHVQICVYITHVNTFLGSISFSAALSCGKYKLMQLHLLLLLLPYSRRFVAVCLSVIKPIRSLLCIEIQVHTCSMVKHLPGGSSVGEWKRGSVRFGSLQSHLNCCVCVFTDMR